MVQAYTRRRAHRVVASLIQTIADRLRTTRLRLQLGAAAPQMDQFGAVISGQPLALPRSMRS